jgi:hypothetical protein
MSTPPSTHPASLSVPKVIALVVAVGLGAFYVGMRTGQAPAPPAASGAPAAGATGDAGARGPALDDLKPKIDVPEPVDLGPSSKSLLGTGSPGGAFRGRPQPPPTPRAPEAPQQTAPSR